MQKGIELFAVTLVVFRIYIAATMEPETATFTDFYKDIAHLFIGGIFVLWMLQKETWQAVIFWGLCLIEVVAAVWSRM